MKNILKLLLLFSIVCSVSFAQIESDLNHDSRALRHTGPATFTGPLAITGQTTLASATFGGVATHSGDIVMASGVIYIATGSEGLPSLALRAYPTTGWRGSSTGWNLDIGGQTRAQFQAANNYFSGTLEQSTFAANVGRYHIWNGTSSGVRSTYGWNDTTLEGLGRLGTGTPCIVTAGGFPGQTWDASGSVVTTNFTVASNATVVGLLNGCSTVASQAYVDAAVAAQTIASAGYTIGNPVTFSGAQMNQVLPVWGATDTINIEDGEIVRLRATVSLKSPGMALFYFDAALSREDGTLTFVGNDAPASPSKIVASPGATLYGAELRLDGNSVGVKASGTNACIGGVTEFELRR